MNAYRVTFANPYGFELQRREVVAATASEAIRFARRFARPLGITDAFSVIGAEPSHDMRSVLAACRFRVTA